MCSLLLYSLITSFYTWFIKYFDANELKPGVFLQDVVNDFLAEKDEKIIAVHPVMEKTLLVHYQE